MRSLQVLQNDGGLMVAKQTPYTAGFIPYLFILLSAGFLIRFLWTRQFRAAVIPGLVLVFVLSDFLTPVVPTYTLILNREKRTLTSEARVKNAVQAGFTVDAEDLNSAEMQFNRGATTIVLVRRDGSLLYPLGEQQLQDEPDQYVVLNAIRQMIGQVPQTEPSQ